MAGKKDARQFGSIRTLPSGRHQARYTGPDRRLYTAPVTFTTKAAANAFLSKTHAAIQAGTWTPPVATGLVLEAPRTVTFRSYAESWLATRNLAERTREEYAGVLTRHVYPRFGDRDITTITPAEVREWHAGLTSARRPGEPLGKTAKAHAFATFRTVLMTATDEDRLIPFNPCRIKGAGKAERARHIDPASLEELEALTAAIPAEFRLLILLAAWCQLRFGELTELRRSDVDTAREVIRVRRGVVRTKANPRLVKEPKSRAGSRNVTIPPHLLPVIREHLNTYVTGRDGLLFPTPGKPDLQLAHSTWRGIYVPARQAAGRPDLNLHDLRHTGAVLAAQTGATIKELMERLGQSTPQAAMTYQHVARGRSKAIAKALSDLAENGGAALRVVND